MERKEQREIRALKESKEHRAIRELRESREHRAIRGLRESKESQARWGHLVRMDHRETQGHQVNRARGVIQVNRENRVRRVTKAIRAKEDVEDHRVREECLGKGGAQAKEEHLETEVAQARGEYREYRDCKAFKACQYIAYLLNRDDQVVSA